MEMTNKILRVSGVLLLLCAAYAHAQGIDYFGLKKEKKDRGRRIESRQEKVARLFSETSIGPDGKIWRTLPPDHVRKLLAEPTEESAKQYLEDEQFKIQALKQALLVLEAAIKKRLLDQLQGVRIVLYTLAGCSACEAQKEILDSAGLQYEEVAGQDVPPDIMSFPTIVLSREGKTLARFSKVTHLEEIIAASREEHARKPSMEEKK